MLVRSRTIEEAGRLQVGSSVVYRPARLGSIAFGEVLYPHEYTLECEDIGSAYFVQVPVAGRFEARHRGRTVVGCRNVAAVFAPEGGPFLGRWSADSRALCVRFDAASVRTALERMLGDQAPERPVPDLRLTTANGYGRSWLDLLLSVNRQVRVVDGLLSQPMMAAPLVDSLLTGFLLATAPARSAVPEPAAARPAAVRTAVELIEADPRAPLTLSMLADHCAVGTRTLQNGFRRHLGMAPMAYVREARLRRAHDELRAADPGTETVAAVAQRWGFAHLGRFAAAHKERYGQTPLRTLHSAS